MARIKLQYPGNHNSAGNIGAEFESLVRYINAAELGDRTLGELLSQIFNRDGQWAGPIELRLTDTALEYRVGAYPTSEEGWQKVADIAEIKGPAGVDVGTIGAPLFSSRVDIGATDGQTVFAYPHDEVDAIVAYVNGVLMGSADYSANPATGEVTFATPLTVSDTVTLYRIQGATASGFSATELTAAAGQAVFPYAHNDQQKLLVYRNGILQREGGSFDYTTSPASDVITFMTTLSVGDRITILRVEDTTAVRLTGLLTEDGYTDGNGLIPISNISIPNDGIAPEKVATLTELLANRGRMFVGSMSPDPSTNNILSGDLWTDTSNSPNVLRFFNGSQWLTTSPETGIPSFGADQATLYVRVNATGTGLELATIDTSALIPKNWKGAANGVAGLDAEGRLPINQLPDTFATRALYKERTGDVADGTYSIHRAFRQTVRIDAIAVKCTSGTANIQLNINGTNVGDVIAVSSTLTEHNLSNSIVVDGTSQSKLIAYTISSATSLTDLDLTLAMVTTNV